jgi:hypothetical protein
MARSKDKQKLQKLKDEIETMKYEGIDHQHPKFQEWKKSARSILKAIYGEGSPILLKFDDVGSKRREDRMWEEGLDIRGKSKTVFKMELERARDILDEALEVAHLLGENGKKIGEEEFISTVSKGTLLDETVPAAEPAAPQAPPPASPEPIPQAVPPARPSPVPPKVIKEVSEGAREKDIEELLRELEKDKKDLEQVQTTLEEALGGISVQSEEERLEELIEQLEEQIKNPNVQMNKVQKTMEELLRVKGKKALLQRLTQETRDPKVPWGKVRGLMKGVWEVDRKFLIDILPYLIED